MATLAIWGAIFMLFGSCTAVQPLQVINEFLQKCKLWFSCPIQLNMAPSSVDDMYEGCETEMENQVKKKFLPDELRETKDFQTAWKAAEKYYNDNRATTRDLKKEEIMALHAYTLDDPPLYAKFNEAVRTQNPKYTTTFAYHTLHFYLTMALRHLKPQKCVTGYRRVSCKFDRDILNKEIRFSAFTSSSMDSYPCEAFGEESCFQIYTCFGADISKFSNFESEKEVLIPPYEVFKVTDIKTRSKKNPLPCKVVYQLKSTKKTLSNLNCALKERLLGFY